MRLAARVLARLLDANVPPADRLAGAGLDWPRRGRPENDNLPTVLTTEQGAWSRGKGGVYRSHRGRTTRPLKTKVDRP